jgi:selenocysteine lyase/cysteine desulfurase
MSQSDHVIESIPEVQWQLSRRSFVQRLAGGAAAAGLLGIGGLTKASTYSELVDSALGLNPADAGDERFWLSVKDQFTVREGLAMMNAANLCPSPYPVMQMVFDLTQDVDADASFQNRGKFRQLKEDARTKLGAFLGADANEIAIVRNTSEANNAISSGFELKDGDEILLSDLNHLSNMKAWEVKSQRYGFKINYFHVDAPPKSEEEIINALRAGITPNTRLISFTHVSNTTGLLMPAKALCAIARERGIFVHVDGAQSFGALNVNLHDMGCDSYSGSAHKWFMGPKEAGVLYVRQARQYEVWPNIVSLPYDDDVVGARKYEALGQRDDGAVSAMGRTVDFHNMLGADRMETRRRQIVSAIKEDLSKVPGISFTTSMDPALSAGVVVFRPGDIDSRKAFAKLYSDYHIAGAGLGPNIRLCPHIYNTVAEADRVVAAVSEMMSSGL